MSDFYCLSPHAAYRCRHSGACCTAGWHIPAEPEVAAAIELHFYPDLRNRLIRTDASSTGPGAFLRTEPGGACTFFDAAGGRLCAIHRDLGELLLPAACRQFPRVSVSDPAGTWVTLSHFCPTAARLLFDPTPLRIVPAPESISLSGCAEGLDATAVLPPLLRPGMLMDFDAYHLWERAAVEMLDTAGWSVSDALSLVHHVTTDIRSWTPGRVPLGKFVTQRVGARPASVAAEPDTDEDLRLHALAVASVPTDLRTPAHTMAADITGVEIHNMWTAFDDVIRRYLASKIFASWWPYLGLDLLSVVEAIRVHAAVLRVNIGRQIEMYGTGSQAMLEAIRDTDLLMVHLSDSRALARLISSTS